MQVDMGYRCEVQLLPGWGRSRRDWMRCLRKARRDRGARSCASRASTTTAIRVSLTWLGVAARLTRKGNMAIDIKDSGEAVTAAMPATRGNALLEQMLASNRR